MLTIRVLLDLMRANATLNLGEATNIHTAELSWGETIDTQIPVEKVALILAADCVYFEVCLSTKRAGLRASL